jgi:hypothetical protein
MRAVSPRPDLETKRRRDFHRGAREVALRSDLPCADASRAGSKAMTGGGFCSFAATVRGGMTARCKKVHGLTTISMQQISRCKRVDFLKRNRHLSEV